MPRDLCDSAKKGNVCIDDLCRSNPDNTLCGFDQSEYEDITREYFVEYDDDEDDEFELDFDCHMGRDGLCGAAGSEQCEFECPYNTH